VRASVSALPELQDGLADGVQKATGEKGGTAWRYSSLNLVEGSPPTVEQAGHAPLMRLRPWLVCEAASGLGGLASISPAKSASVLALPAGHRAELGVAALVIEHLAATLTLPLGARGG
jgi:hypothetical protein